MNNSLGKHTDLGILIIRIGIGLSFIFVHGLGKITGGPERWAKLGEAMSSFGINFFPTFWGFMAAFSEFVVPFFLIAGFLFRPAAFLMAFTMFTAMSKHLIGLDPWSKVIYPMELMFVFIALILTGPGKYSVWYLMNRRKKKE
ncbi:MAG TPA: DoxX family protein [Ignavibacteria bacterium]|nr:DoxX family protein [Ignavibacteria bacterium]HMR39613.1 DoxX family protein [Ignavibacteria bacterium]